MMRIMPFKKSYFLKIFLKITANFGNCLSKAMITTSRVYRQMEEVLKTPPPIIVEVSRRRE
jgi:hypothetical protein